MAYVPSRPTAEYLGRLYLMYVNNDVDQGRSFRNKRREVRMLLSHVKFVEPEDGGIERQELVGLSSPFDNIWSFAFGIDLLFEQGIDSNLRAVVSRAGRRNWTQIWFRPKADGIHDFTLDNYNDWEILLIGLCRNVVNPGGTVSDPIECP